MKCSEDDIVYQAEVPFHDCDPLGIVWHGHYYKYLEHARTVLLRNHRLDVADFQELGFRLFMIETRCRHTHPLRYGDQFDVRARFQETETRIRIAYEVRNRTRARRAARAWTTLVTLRDDDMLWETPLEIQARIRG